MGCYSSRLVFYIHLTALLVHSSARHWQHIEGFQHHKRGGAGDGFVRICSCVRRWAAFSRATV